MDGITVKKLARDLKLPVYELIEQLQQSGTKVTSENDLVSGEQQLRLLKQTRTREPKTEAKEDVSLADLKAAKDLVALNDLLTRAMANRTIQALIKDDDLQTVSDAIVERAAKEGEPLLAAAMLGRLAAVARSEARASRIHARADEVLIEEPVSVANLPDTDGKQKQYAAQMLAHATAPWVVDYRYREALAIDTADNARRELMSANLEQENTFADWIVAITRHASELSSIESAETRLKRVRRIFGTIVHCLASWRGNVGDDAGSRLAECLRAFLTGKLAELDQEVLFETVDYLLDTLVRVIERRFSIALNAETYALIDQAKKTLGAALWGRFIQVSEHIPDVQVALLESALVLARQSRSDRQIMGTLNAIYTSKAQLIAALKRHFAEARDLDPETLDWWVKGEAETKGQQQDTQRFRSTEDEKIGELLIQVEGSREVMEKLGRAVLPLLENFDPVLAETVNRATVDYMEMAQLVRGLARLRRLTPTDDVGRRIEYNLRKHDMVGGHKSGVRMVRVVRDGVEKEFNGIKTILVKPWVKPED